MFEKDYDSVLVKYHVSRYHSPDDVKKITNLFNQLSKKSYSHSQVDWTKNQSVPRNSFITSSDQFCTVKMNFSNSMESHRKFYEKYMPQLDKKSVSKKPELFGNISLDDYKKKVRSSKYDKPYYINRRNGKKMPYSRHYKFVLSPEKQLDEKSLKIYTQMFVKKMEQSLGFKINYQASIHTDTEHNHVHLLINGVNQKDEQFKIPRDFIKNEGRKISSEILTSMCGKRDNDLIQSARERRVTAQRWTEFDEIILNKMLRSDDKKYQGKFPFCVEGEIGKRLQFLRRLGVVDFEHGYYLIKKDMKDTLKALGRYNKFLEAKKFVNSDKPMTLYTSDMGRIKGKVTHIYSMNDEDVWTNAIVLESENKAYFIPLYNPVDKDLKLNGKEIVFESLKNEKGKLHSSFFVVNNSENEIKSDMKKHFSKKNTISENDNEMDYE